MSVRAWHALGAEEALREVGSSGEGLSSGEARARLARDGRNELSARRGVSWLRKLGEQFLQPLVVVLLGSAGLSVFLGDWVDAAVIGSVVLLNGVIGFFQEHRAERSISALSKVIVTEATTLRDGRAQRVPSAELVRGDVVSLQSGDTVPADLRLLDVRDMKVEEAGLTGESVPAEKRVGVLGAEASLGDRENMAFAGSAVTYGVARGVVVATGDATETGRIARLMATTAALETPLTRRIAQLSRVLVWLILGLAAALVVFSIVVPTFIGSLVFEGLGAFSAFGASLAGVAVAILLCGWMLLFANTLSIWTGNSGTGLLLAVVLWVVMGISGFLVPEVQRFLPTSLALGNGAELSFSGLSMLLACYIIVTIMGMYAFQRKEF